MKHYFLVNQDSVVEFKESEVGKLRSGIEDFIACELGLRKPGSNSDYIKYAKKLGFRWEENAEAGCLNYDYKANFMMEMIKQYARILVRKAGFPVYEVRGANMFDLSHPVVDAYAKLYGNRLYRFKSGDKEVVMSYDSSYPQFNLASNLQLNEKDLPFAHFSLADCYRHEQSGECMLLYRERRFFMADLHPYFKDVDQAFEYYEDIQNLLVEAAAAVNRKYYLSLEVSSMANWEKYKEQIVGIARRFAPEVFCLVNDDDKDRYWIVNNDYKIIDKLGQSREICCIQIDVGNAERLGIKYSAGKKYVYPAIIHAAVPGGLERYIYMILDDYRNCMPMWLQPIQVRLVPVSKDYFEFAYGLQEKLSRRNIRVDVDDRNESVGKRIKLAKEELIPEVIVVGREEKDGVGNMPEIEKIVMKNWKDSKDKPFLPISWPVRLSRRMG